MRWLVVVPGAVMLACITTCVTLAMTAPHAAWLDEITRVTFVGSLVGVALTRITLDHVRRTRRITLVETGLATLAGTWTVLVAIAAHLFVVLMVFGWLVDDSTAR